MIHPITHRGSANCLIVEVLPPSGESAHRAAVGGVQGVFRGSVSYKRQSLPACFNH